MEDATVNRMTYSGYISQFSHISFHAGLPRFPAFEQSSSLRTFPPFESLWTLPTILFFSSRRRTVSGAADAVDQVKVATAMAVAEWWIFMMMGRRDAVRAVISN